MLRAIPVSDPQHLVVFGWKAHKEPDLSGHTAYGDCHGPDCSLSVPYLQSIKAHGDAAFSDAAASLARLRSISVGTGRRQSRWNVCFRWLLLEEMLGVSTFSAVRSGPRTRLPEPPPASCSDYSYWRRAFASDAGVLGRAVRLNNNFATIIGVADPRFTNFTPGNSRISTYHFRLSLVFHSEWWPDADRYFDPAAFWVVIIGRLKPGVSIAQAQGLAATIFRNQVICGNKQLFTEADDPTIQLIPFNRGLNGQRSQIAQMLYLMMIGVGMVLLIACANVAGLMSRVPLAAKGNGAAYCHRSRARPNHSPIADRKHPSVYAGRHTWCFLAMWGVRAITALCSPRHERHVSIRGRTQSGAFWRSRSPQRS